MGGYGLSVDDGTGETPMEERDVGFEAWILRRGGRGEDAVVVVVMERADIGLDRAVLIAKQ